MRTDTVQPSRPPNCLLASLSQADYEALRPRLELVHLEQKSVVYEHGSPISHVYFPCNAVLSLVIVMSDGAAAEAATVGIEGMVGLSLLAGVGTAVTRVLCQVPGEAVRLDAAVFCEVAQTQPRLRAVVARYTQFLWEQVAQAAACNRLHTNEERMARWLLMTRDRVGADAFAMTHEVLAELLGVGRPTVTLIAGALQQAGLIQYRRGHLVILDPGGLETVACECYLVLRNRFTALLGPARDQSAWSNSPPLQHP